MTIARNIQEILAELPKGVSLEAAAKTRTPEEILEAIDAGVKIIGENYVQQAERAKAVIGNRAEWHLIGHLQRNKVKKAVELFDMIETVDSEGLAQEIDRRCREADKTMPVLIEINSGREPGKSGVYPEDAVKLVSEVSVLRNIRVMGLMTMGPVVKHPEEIRPFFSETKILFDQISAMKIPNVVMKYLSMGMTDSYRIAIQEGANIVRIGNRIFDSR